MDKHKIINQTAVAVPSLRWLREDTIMHPVEPGSNNFSKPTSIQHIFARFNAVSNIAGLWIFDSDRSGQRKALEVESLLRSNTASLSGGPWFAFTPALLDDALRKELSESVLDLAPIDSKTKDKGFPCHDKLNCIGRGVLAGNLATRLPPHRDVDRYVWKL